MRHVEMLGCYMCLWEKGRRFALKDGSIFPFRRQMRLVLYVRLSRSAITLRDVILGCHRVRAYNDIGKTEQSNVD